MNKPKLGLSTSSFTLLELLVVIGIIAVLLSIGMVSYSAAQKKARDAKRRGDLTAVQNCLEQDYATKTLLPYTYQILSNPLPGVLNCGGTNTMTAPTDPLSPTYNYVVTNSTSSTYTITATLEGGSPFVVEQRQ